MSRVLTLSLGALLLFAACTSSEGASPPGSSSGRATSGATPTSTAVSVTSVVGKAYVLYSPIPTPVVTAEPTPVPTVSPTPVPIFNGGPYVVAIEAGHGGPSYWGASSRDRDGNLWIEKDVVLDISERLYWLLDADERYVPVMIRSGDTTLTAFDGANYRPSLIAEAQARVDVANSVDADVYLAIHLNGWHDSGMSGTETYYNPDRSFGYQSHGLATYVQDALVRKIREAGYEVNDRGLRNDSDVNGDPANQHSFALGTNVNFNPSLMPGVISESLFLTSASDLEFIRTEGAFDVIAGAYKMALDNYLAWLESPQ